MEKATAKATGWEDDEDYDSDEGETGFGLAATNDIINKKEKRQEATQRKGDWGLDVIQKNTRSKSPSKNSSDQRQTTEQDQRQISPQNRKNHGNRENKNNRDDFKKRRDDKGPREPREKRTFEFNPKSNFRVYYLNDPLFYEQVIRKEEAPYDFKIHLFLDNPKEDKLQPKDISVMVCKKLLSFNAANVRDFIDNRGGGEKNSDRIRFTFVIDNKDDALECFRFFTDYGKNQRRGSHRKESKDQDFQIEETIKIYLQKEEEVFEKYGDIEADLYTQMVKIEQQKKAERKTQYEEEKRQKRKEREEDDKTGFNFSREGPQRFNNYQKNPKQEGDHNRKVIELENNSKDLRQIINSQKEQEHRGGERRRGGGNHNQRQYQKRQVFDDADYDMETDEYHPPAEHRNDGRSRGGQKQYQPKRNDRQQQQERKQYDRQQPEQRRRGGGGPNHNRDQQRDGDREPRQRGGRGANNHDGDSAPKQEYKKKKQGYNDTKPKEQTQTSQGQDRPSLSKQASNTFAGMDDGFE